MHSKRFKHEPLDLRPKRFTRPDGGESVKHFLPELEFKRSSGHWLKQLRGCGAITLTGISPSIRVEDGNLSITQGSTLADLDPVSVCYPRAVHGLTWVIVDSPNGYVTVDGIRWLHAQQIGFMIVTTSGGIILHDVAKPIVSLRRRQYSIDVMRVSRWVLYGKIATYLRLFHDIPNREELRVLRLDNVHTINELHLIEGRIAGVYWKYQAFTLKSYKKFPPWWNDFTQRSSGIGANNKHATHPINAMLNYAYAVIAGMIKRKCMLVGLDVAVGSLHADNDRRDSLCYDLLELLRGDVDYVLLSWAKTVKWRRTDFITSEKGVVSLDNNLRRVVVEKIAHLQRAVDKIVKDYTLFLLRS